MATYYVDLTNGSNSNNGLSETTPKKDFTTWASSITSGDTILVKRGSSAVLTSGTRLNITISNSTATTTIDAYGSGVNPVLSGGATGPADGNFNPVYVKRHDGSGKLVIRNLDVTAAPASGFVIESQVGVTINNVLVENCNAYGNNVRNLAGNDGFRVCCIKDGGLISNITFKNCNAYNNNGHGIKIRDNTVNCQVIKCNAWGNGLGSPAHGMGTAHSRATVASAGAWVATSGGAYQATITTTALSKTTITEWFAVYCTNQNGYFWLTPSTTSPPALGKFYTGGSNTLEINVGVAPTAATVTASYLPVNAVFIGCSSWDTNDSDGAEGHGFGTDDMTTSVQYIGCSSFNNEGAGWTFNISQQGKMTGCVARNNLKQGVWVTGKNTTVHQSTLVNNTLQGFRTGGGGFPNEIKNCIFKSNGGYGISSSSPSYTIDENYNCVFSNTGGSLENVSSQGANTITTDPLLDESLFLKMGSPSLNAGTKIQSRDFAGKYLYEATPDLGAKQKLVDRTIVTNRVIV